MLRRARLNRHEEAALAAAVLFTATVFRGRSEYAVVEAATLDGAIAAAPRLYEDRPVSIRAYDAAGRYAIVGTWEPDRR